MRIPAPVPARLTTSRTIRSSTPLVGIRQAAAEYADADDEALPDAEREYDVFISHASEDQPEIVRPLVSLLEERGLSVWYSETVLRVGSSLRRSIDAGLRNSRFGVVVLSPNFFAKRWPNWELDGLVTRSQVEGRQLILPVWHNVSVADVTNYSAPLGDKFALDTAKDQLAEIARQIADAVRADISEA
jgi:hypothetical protein